MAAVAVGVSALAIAALSVGLSAQEADDLLGPFTAGEVATWAADRTFPTDGFTSVTAFGRNDVARLGIDSANPSPVSAFYRTEGVQKAEHYGDAVQVDLYLDPAWKSNATRAGVWVFDRMNFPGRPRTGLRDHRVREPRGLRRPVRRELDGARARSPSRAFASGIQRPRSPW